MHGHVRELIGGSKQHSSFLPDVDVFTMIEIHKWQKHTYQVEDPASAHLPLPLRSTLNHNKMATTYNKQRVFASGHPPDY